MKTNQDLRENIDKILKARNISRKEFSEIMGMHYQNLLDYLNGKLPISLEKLNQFTQALGIDYTIQLISTNEDDVNYGAEVYIVQYSNSTVPPATKKLVDVIPFKEFKKPSKK